MFFILSKVLDFLLSPMVWIVGFFITSWVLSRPVYKKGAFYTGLGLLVFFSNPFFADLAFRAWEGEPVPMSSIGNYELGIVLTGVAFNREEAPDRVFFSKGADRVLHTVQLYKAGKIKKILITGGSGSLVGKGIPEAGRLREVMLYSGVPDSVIIIENKSRNTRENAVFTKQMVDSLNLPGKYLLITSAFHMSRSLGCFEKAGMSVDTYKVDFFNESQLFEASDLIPNGYGIYKWTVLIHEIFGFILYGALGYL